MTKIGNRIIPYATALSIRAASEELVNMTQIGQILKVKLMPFDCVQIGGPGLCFKDKNLTQVVKTGFAFPLFSPFIRNLGNSFKSIAMLLRIRKILSIKDANVIKVSLGLRAGLAATAAYANFDYRFDQLLDGQREKSALFKVSNTNISIMFYFFKDVWSVGTGNFSFEPSVVFTFKDISIANLAISGSFDHIGGPSLGDAEISGNIPFLDKVGFISRIVQKEVPSML